MLHDFNDLVLIPFANFNVFDPTKFIWILLKYFSVILRCSSRFLEMFRDTFWYDCETVETIPLSASLFSYFWLILMKLDELKCCFQPTFKHNVSNRVIYRNSPRSPPFYKILKAFFAIIEMNLTEEGHIGVMELANSDEKSAVRRAT